MSLPSSGPAKRCVISNWSVPEGPTSAEGRLMMIVPSGGRRGGAASSFASWAWTAPPESQAARMRAAGEPRKSVRMGGPGSIAAAFRKTRLLRILEVVGWRVQNFAHLAGEDGGRERLLKERRALLDHPVA